MPLARVMPNLAVETRQGVLCYDAADTVDESLDQRLKELLALLGTVIEVDDSQIDAATAVMGCSPGLRRCRRRDADRGSHKAGDRP